MKIEFKTPIKPWKQLNYVSKSFMIIGMTFLSLMENNSSEWEAKVKHLPQTFLFE